MVLWSIHVNRENEKGGINLYNHLNRRSRSSSILSPSYGPAYLGEMQLYLEQEMSPFLGQTIPPASSTPVLLGLNLFVSIYSFENCLQLF